MLNTRAKFPETTLYAGTPEQIGKAKDLERIVDLRLGGPMGTYGHATNSPLGRPPEPEKAAQCLAAMQTPLDYLEQLLGDGRPLLGGDRVNVADCTMQSSLQFMRFVEADVFGDRPLLRAWDERYRARPAASCTQVVICRCYAGSRFFSKLLGLEDNICGAPFPFTSADCYFYGSGPTQYRLYLC